MYLKSLANTNIVRKYSQFERFPLVYVAAFFAGASQLQQLIGLANQNPHPRPSENTLAKIR